MHVPDWTRQFERYRLGPRNDWNIRSILKAREKPALHHSIQSLFGKRFHEEISRHHISTNLPESARSSRISRIPPNLPDPVESPGFSRIHSIRRIRRTRAHGFINIEPPSPTVCHSSGISAWTRAHRQESLRTSSGIDRAGMKPSCVILV